MDPFDVILSLGEEESPNPGGHPVIPPVFQTANFSFPDVAALQRAFADEAAVHLYTRGNHPTTALLRQKIAALEGAEDALVFASGVAAICAAIMSQVRQGDHVVAVRDAYPWTTWLLRDYLSRFGVSCSFVDGRDLEAVEQAFKPNTRLLVLESPNSFLFELQDLAAMSALAARFGCRTMVDNSYAGPLFQQPIRMGIDLVVHSASKYLNGHGDVIAGVVCGRRELLQPMFQEEFQGLGAILSPHDAWLMLRGLRTLPLRMVRSGSTAMELVRRLATHPQVRRVIYPYHPSHPDHALALQQMSGPSGQFSIELQTDDPEYTRRFCDGLTRFKLAVSWGGLESLVVPAIAKKDSALPPGLIRFYAGLESPEVLWQDLEQSFQKLRS